LLSEFNESLAELIESKKIKLETLPIKAGFIHKQERILLLTDYQIFNKPYRSKLPQKKKYSKIKIQSIRINKERGLCRPRKLWSRKVCRVANNQHR
jgi:hypothetical protein